MVANRPELVSVGRITLSNRLAWPRSGNQDRISLSGHCRVAMALYGYSGTHQPARGWFGSDLGKRRSNRLVRTTELCSTLFR